MSDAENTAEAGEQVQNNEPTDQAFNPITSQEDLDRIIQKRLDRERSKFSDYDDVKAAASKAADLEAANADLTAKVQGFEARDARASVVAKVAKDKGVSADLLARMTGDSEEDLAASADTIREVLKVSGPVVSTAGKSPDQPSSSPSQDLVRDLFGK